jgi:hypothetical protein
VVLVVVALALPLPRRVAAVSAQVEVARQGDRAVVTVALSTPSPADHGTWFYRVRGINPNLPTNSQKMTWSSAIRITITGNRFAILR